MIANDEATGGTFFVYESCVCTVQVLLLWDRVIGYDSLLVLPLAAAAVLAWRGAMLRECSSAEEAAAVLEYLSQLQIVPLLQSLLFLTGSSGSVEG